MSNAICYRCDAGIQCKYMAIHAMCTNRFPMTDTWKSIWIRFTRPFLFIEYGIFSNFVWIGTFWRCACSARQRERESEQEQKKNRSKCSKSVVYGIMKLNGFEGWFIDEMVIIKFFNKWTTHTHKFHRIECEVVRKISRSKYCHNRK